MFFLAMFGTVVSAQAQVSLETQPAAPVRGSLALLAVTPAAPDSVVAITGEVGGEPLHLESRDGITWRSLFGIPFAGDSEVEVTLALTQVDGAVDTLRRSLAVLRGTYAVERLRVAPRMAEPDSAARARIARENALARRVSRAAHGTPQQWDEPFALPRPSRMTSTFGTGREFNGRVVSRHFGTDFQGRLGEPVYAANRGLVVLVADFYLAGKVVYLDHGRGLVSAYFHLSRAAVREGDTVERGQLIGAVGQSGRVTGPHLHWVTRYGAVTVNPESVVALPGWPAAPGKPANGS